MLIFAVVALIVPASTVPVTLKFVRPVRLLMFAFVAVKVPLTVALLILAVVILAVVAVKLVRFARLVILFKVLALKVPLKVPPVIVPVLSLIHI